MTPRLALFGGTTEGRQLLEHGIPALCCVATEYGARLLEGLPHADVRVGRLDEAAMERFFTAEGVTHVIDATHPYAAEVTKNIRQACAALGLPYLRVLRRPTPLTGDVVQTASPEEAAALLDASEEKVLLTVGSKELPVFAQVKNAASRIYPRVLPVSSVIAQAESLGFDAGHIIAMQGPFSAAMNEQMLDMTGAKTLVTKDGGDAGGTREKLEAARNRGVRVLLIGRPAAEEGATVEEALLWARRALGLHRPPFFPLLISLEGKKVLIAGGGPVALRRAATLKRCGAQVCAVAPDFCSPAAPPEKDPWQGVSRIRRRWLPSDLDGAVLAVAATNSREQNRLIADEAKKRNIPVSVADNAAEGTFFFPALIAEGETSLSVSTGGLSPALTHRLADRLRSLLPDLVAELREQAGESDETRPSPEGLCRKD